MVSHKCSNGRLSMQNPKKVPVSVYKGIVVANDTRSEDKDRDLKIASRG